MNFLKRALISVKSHRVKSIVITVAIAVIATVLLCALVISTASEKVQSEALKNIGAQVEIRSKSVRYKLDIPEKYDNVYIKTYKFSNSMMEKLEALPQVESSNRIYFFIAEADNFKTFYVKDGSESQYYSQNINNLVTFLSVTDSAKLNEFATGTYKLVSGRDITKADTGKCVAVINENLAKSNNIKLHDSINVKQAVTKQNTIYSFEVVGIFKAPEVSDFEKNSSYSDPGNLIYTSDNSNNSIRLSTDDNPYDVLSPEYKNAFVKRDELIRKIDPDYGKILTPEELKEDLQRAYFYLDDPSDIEAFMTAAKQISGMENFELTTNGELYSRVTAPVKATGAMANIMIIVTLVSGCIILSLIVILSLKGRRREFGILLAMGEKKLKIVTQVFVETLIPVCVAFIIAVAVNIFASQAVSNQLLSNELEKSQQPIDQVTMIMQHKNSNTDFNTNNAYGISDISASVTPGDIGKFAACGIVIVLLAAAAPCVKILRLSPMTVLSKKE